MYKTNNENHVIYIQARLHRNHFLRLYIIICIYKKRFACAVNKIPIIIVIIQIIDSNVPPPGYNISYVYV